MSLRFNPEMDGIEKGKAVAGILCGLQGRRAVAGFASYIKWEKTKKESRMTLLYCMQSVGEC